MALLIALVWLLALPGIGALLLRQRDLGFGYLLLSGGIVGCTLAGVVLLALSHLGQLAPPQVFLSTALLCLAGLLGWRHLLSVAEPSPWTSVRAFWQGLDVWDRGLVWASGLCLLIMLLDAWTPPRGADAMRYHLAQMEDMVRNQGFVFRPYNHYNFPIYYAYLTMPIYFLVGGIGVKLFNFLFVGVVAGVTYALGRAAGVGRPLVLVLGVLMTPGILRAATTVNNDLGVLAFGLGGILLLHGYRHIRRRSFLILAYVSFGFAVGVKYQSALFLPWYLWLTWVALGQGLDWSGLKVLALLGLIAMLPPAPFFARNYLNTGVPDWPMHQELFGAEHDHLYEISTKFTASWTGSHDLGATSSAFKSLISSGYTIPSMWLFSLLGLYLLVRRGRDPTGLYLAFGIVSHLILWWIIQPKLYARFGNYLVPQLMVAGVVGFDLLRSLWLRRAALALAVASAGMGFVFLAIYSQGLIRYHVDGDLERFHDFTWFHDEYTWMDEHLPEDANILVVTLSGHTYYVPRNYLRADPTHSALIDWRQLDLRTFHQEMQRLGIDYIFYQNLDWTSSVGGVEMMALMEELIEENDIELLWKRDVVLGTSRIRGKTVDTEAWMLKLDPPDRSGDAG